MRNNWWKSIIWCNPPFSKNVKIVIGIYFLHLLDKHYGKNHKHHKIFNRHNLKVSYSCMDNMNTIISCHNKIISNCKEKKELLTQRKLEITIWILDNPQTSTLTHRTQNLKPVIITLHNRPETVPPKKALNYRNIYGVWKIKINVFALDD